MHNGVDQSGGVNHAQEHTHESSHAHLHTHTGEHTHQHEGLAPSTVHTHEHTHNRTHEHDLTQEGEAAHQHDPDDGADRAEVVALLAYTLQHNHHHNAELLEMQLQLGALGFRAEAELLGASIADFATGNARLADILKILQE